MNSPESKTSLPIWLFVVTDLALVGAAAVVAFRSAQPLSSGAMLWIVALVASGAIVGLVPIIARYERQKNETLDNRQRALETLSQTVAASAEQISIATGSLNEIAELAQKNLRQTEHLPHKLQEKIAEFQAQLAAADDTEKEELEKELNELRASESERLDSISTKIARSTVDWAKLETAAAQHLSAATEAIAKLPANTTAAIAKAQAAADHALAEARLAAAKTIAEAEAAATRAITRTQAASLAALDAKLIESESRLANATTTSADRAATELRSTFASANTTLESKIVQLEALALRFESLAAKMHEAPITPSAPPLVEIQPEPPPPAASEGHTAAAEIVPSIPVEAPTHPPSKRHRRARREESNVAETAPAPISESPVSGAGAVTVAPAEADAPAVPPPEPAAAPLPVEEPPPVPAEKIAEVASVVPDSSAPFIEPPPSEPAVTASSTPSDATVEAEPPTPIQTGRKRAARKPEPDPSLDLPLEDSPASAAPGHVERTLASDGATRLLATAYIGIGNRLFIRGDGPGLSWEKGVPLQFVSIGKWRWETNEANAPVRFRLYKNDELECTALGEQTLEPGHLQEMTATF